MPPDCPPPSRSICEEECEIGKANNCPRAKGDCYDAWGEGLGWWRPDYCPQPRHDPDELLF